jgi:beta-glucosidase
MTMSKAVGLVFGLAAITSVLPAYASEASSVSSITSATEDDSDSAYKKQESLCLDISQALHYSDWPRIESRIRSDADQEVWIDRVVSAMTIEQKVGQMTQAEMSTLFDRATGSYRMAEVTQYALGSVFGGGGVWPYGDKHASVQDWISVADGVWEASPVVAVPVNGGAPEQIRIPAFWGQDAVHGHGAVFGATLFPHNIGVGATGDTRLAYEIGRATARAVRATGVDWTFGPCVAVARHDRWGRTYESFSEDPGLVRAMGASMTACQTPLNFGDDGYDPQFPLGYGLRYVTNSRVGMLDDTAGPIDGCAR